jgi:hypothetical protein
MSSRKAIAPGGAAGLQTRLGTASVPGQVRLRLPSASFAKAKDRARVDRSHAPRGNAARDAPRPFQSRTRSVRGGIPTRERGNDHRGNVLLRQIQIIHHPIHRQLAEHDQLRDPQQRPALRRGYEMSKVMGDGSG